MPPVSMHRVWLAARMARGQASSRVERTPLKVNMPGAWVAVTTYSTTRTPVRATAGRSTRVWRQSRAAGRAVVALTATSAGSEGRWWRSPRPPGDLQQPADHHDHDDDDPAGDLGVVGVPPEPEHQRRDQGQAERGQHRPEQGPPPP